MAAIVQVVGYGDFDIPQTQSVWINESIDSFDTKQLSDFGDEVNSDKVEKELKQLGFKRAKTKSVIYGGNL